MRAEGVAVVAVAAFGLSFVAGMAASSEPATTPKTPVAAAGKPLKLATADALPGIVAAEPAAPEKKRKPKPKPKPKRVVRAPAPRVVVRAPAPVVRATPAPPPASAPAPVATAAPPTTTPKPRRTPSPAPTFDDGGEPNSGEFENGGTP